MILRVIPVLLLLTGYTAVALNKIPIGVIVKPGEELELEALRRSFWLKEKVLDIRPHSGFEIFTEVVEDGNAVLLDRAVCRLLNNGIQALIATTTPFSYRMLLPYSNDYNLPLISPSFPEISPESVPHHGVSIKPSTIRPVLDLIRYYGWKDIVYLYDSDDGPERLQQIFLLGYRVLKTRLVGILRVNQSEEANAYIRKLDFMKKYRSFHVILDMKAELARDIIVRHVHDVHVGKSYFHYLITELALEEFWNQNTAEMGSVNVTGFRLMMSDNLAAKHFNTYLQQSILQISGKTEVPASAYYAYDAALVVSQAFENLSRLTPIIKPPSNHPLNANATRSCLVTEPLRSGLSVSGILKEMELTNGITGKIRFGFTGTRKNYGVEVIETNRLGHRVVAQWTDTNGLKISSAAETPFPSASARVDSRRRFKITSILSLPYLMLNSSSNTTSPPKGNDRYTGFIKDLIELLAREMDFDYDISLVADGQYGQFDESSGQWNGMIGEVIRMTADLAVGDLIIFALRQRVVDFTEPFQLASLSLLMKNPASVAFSSPYFIFSSFAGNVWICILAAAIVVTLLLYVIGKFTGSPDSIESASGLWGKKFTPVNSVWFTSGSLLLQSTGIYPRSASSRILGAAWWCFTLIMLSLFIANITCQLHMDRMDTQQIPQLAKLRSLSLESIVAESVLRGWPAVGLIRSSTTEKFIRMSNLSTYREYSKVLDSNPGVLVSTAEEGIQRVRRSNGNFGFLTESSRNEYVSNQEPCDTVAIQDAASFMSYGVAIPMGSPLKAELNDALRKIRERGEMGNLHRKWWIEGSPCLEKDFFKVAKNSSLNLSAMSGIFYVIFICLGLTAIITVAQYFWRAHRKEERRRKLSFEDMTLGQPSLPLPHPELLAEPPVEEDSGLIDGWSERRLIPTSFGEPSSS